MKTKPFKYFDYKYYLGILALLVINFLAFSLAGGEEQYLGFTAQWSDPNWIVNSFSFTEFAGTRLVFQWITAPFVSFFGIETAAYVLRFLNFAAIALPISLLFKRMNYSWLVSLVALQCFFILGQSFFGGEWIIKTYEPKSIAYIFVFFAIYYFSIEDYIKCSIHLVLATYFHFLVGGWVLILLGIILLTRKEWIPSVKALSIYILLLSPFIIYLFQGYFLETVTKEGITADWIYCYFRLPHHTGIFKDYDFFIKDSLTGVIMSLFFFLLVTRKNVLSNYPFEKQIISICFGINLIFVALAWVDGIYLEQRASFLVKYYPFRLNGIGLFFTCLISLSYLYKICIVTLKKNSVNIIFYASGLILLFFTFRPSYSSSRLSSDEAFDQIARKSTDVTEPESVFAIIDIPLYDGKMNRFPRLSRRDLMGALKFTPAESGKLYEWHDRINLMAELDIDLQHLSRCKEEFGVTHVLCKRELKTNEVELIHSNDIYYIYQIR